MKATRLFLLICLTIILLPGSVQMAQSDDLFMVPAVNPGLLKNGGQFTELSLDDSGNWSQIMPDGSTQTFSWGNGKTFVLTYVSARFYADTTNTNPYRLYLKAPNGIRLWVVNLSDVTYPTTGSTVWGGAQNDAISPGIAITVKPMVEVRQLPQPPTDPNTGPVLSGTPYIRIAGYVVP